MTHGDPVSWRAVARGYLVLPHAVPILVVLTATTAFALIAAGGWPGFASLICLLGAMFGGQLAIGAVNELVDADLDAAAKPMKPISTGLVSRRGARRVVIAGVVAMCLFSFRFSWATFTLCSLGTGSGIAYSFWFKRTIWSWIPYLVALPLLPIWVWSALDGVNTGLFAIYPIGAAAVIAVQIAQSLPDVDADHNSGVRTLAVALGSKRAHLVCWAATIAAALTAAFLAPWLTGHAMRVWLAAVVAVLLVGVNVLLWRQDLRRGALASFPCIALAAATLGVGWASALVNL